MKCKNNNCGHVADGEEGFCPACGRRYEAKPVMMYVSGLGVVPTHNMPNWPELS